MNRTYQFVVSIPAVLVLLLVGLSTTVSAGPKEDICHFPPGNPANFHTITVSVNAVDAHVANHGDVIGSCCGVGSICDDGNACTANFCIDDACTSEPADCNDSVACTDDSCDSVEGCLNVPNDANCATGEVCDPVDGCNSPAVTCPCWPDGLDLGTLHPNTSADLQECYNGDNVGFREAGSDNSSVRVTADIFNGDRVNGLGCFLIDTCDANACSGINVVRQPAATNITSDEYDTCLSQVRALAADIFDRNGCVIE